MAITKYATIEKILEIKSSNKRLTYEYDSPEYSGLSKFAALQDGVREEDGYLYVRCRAISSRVNKNNDGWPSEELANGYKTFEARPIFVDHNNSDPRRTRGVIVDSTLHVEDADKVSALDPYYASAPENHKPPTWIELLLEVDADTYPKLAEKVKTGEIDAVSMGANIDRSVCSVCANEAATPSEYCNHIKQKGLTFEITSDNGEKIKKKAYEDCYGVNFFEISFVFDPADPTADVLSKSASLNPEILRRGANETGVNYDEIKRYLAIKGITLDEEPSLSEMVGRNLPVDKVAALKLAVPTAEDFMAPKDQEPEYIKNKNYVPQTDQITAPEHVDTLRNDQRCPICHAAEMEVGADGIMACPICGHVQEPEPVDNPDLELARDNELRQQVQDPSTQTQPETQAINALDNVEFSSPTAQPTSKTDITSEGISEMFSVKLRTTSKEEADKILPVKVARVEAKLGHGVHRGVYDAAREAGLKVKVAYPGIKDKDNSVEVPGDNGIFNLFFAEESALNLKVPMNEVPVIIEANSEEEAQRFAKILEETPLPSRGAKNNKRAILQDKKPSDEPKNPEVISDQQKPVEAKIKEAVSIDGVVELDGKKYRLDPVDEGTPEEEESKEAPAEEEEAAVEEAETSDETSEADDREAKLLAAFTLADMSVEMGLVDQENKMAYVAELEEETLEQLVARKATLESVKTAGLSRRSASSPLHGIKRVPRLSNAVPSLNGHASYNDTPDEALFL